MTELARGSVGDRPWGRTLAALGLRAVTGQLTLLSDGKHFLVAFEHGAVVAAASPLASDAAVRVALTSHLISSSQVPEISRRQAATPERDEIDVIAELARLGPDHTLRLRRRVIAQRAARSFSINHGEFLVTDETELQVLPGCELDIRAIIYMGARANLPELRLAAELDQLGGWFRLKASLDDDLPQFGFTDVEQPVVERLRDGGTLAELEDFATSFVDARTVRAVVYALAAYNACEVGPAPPGAHARRAEASSPGLVATQPMPRITAPGAPLAHSVPRPFTQPIPRTVTPPGTPPIGPTGGPRTTTPTGPASRTVTPAAAGRTVTPPAERAARAAERAATGAQQTEPMTTFAAYEGAALVGRAATVAQQTEPMTVLPDGALADSPPQAPRARHSTPPPPDARFDPPTQRDAPGEPPPSEAPRPRRLSELAAPRDGSSPGLSRPLEPPPRERPAPSPPPPLERRASPPPVPRGRPTPSPPLEGRPAPSPRQRARSSPGLAGPLDDYRPRETLRFATDDVGAGSSPALRYPSDDPSAREGHAAEPSRQGSSPGLRRPEQRDAVDPWDPTSNEPTHGDDLDAADLALPLLDSPTHRDLAALGYSAEADPYDRGGAPPDAGAARATRSTDTGAPGARPESARAASSSEPPRAGAPDAGLVIRRMPLARPLPTRQVARNDSPQAHGVKALIAQRLKLLDQGADHFQLLGAAQDAAPDTLRKAYFALARQLHPDRLAALGISDDGKHAQRLFAQINAGFAILSDPARREHYVSVLRRGGEAAIRAEQARAEELANRILEAEEAFHRGELALRRDQPQAALVELERAIQLNPDEADYHALLAWAQFCTAPDKMTVAQATRAALDQAIQRAPRSVTARFFLGRVERMLGRDQEALRHFREVLDAAPGHLEASAEVRVLESRLSGGRKR